MSHDDKLSEKGLQERHQRWEEIGLDAIKADLLTGGHRLVGGTPAVRRAAWEWVRRKESERAKDSFQVLPVRPTSTPPMEDGPAGPHRRELFILRPGLYGVNLDLKEAWRRGVEFFRRCSRGTR
ncbi:MAG TPA: hypothetical protein VMF53_06625 [Alphaproteobacteria bacterium]|nr:hypothetical protein [Alphaproteobacteria bacterium]